MGVCTKCGRERTGPARFCTGCGAQFTDAGDATPPVAGASVQPAPPEDPAAAPAPVAQTTVEPAWPAQETPGAAPPAAPNWAPPDLTRWDTRWYKPDPAPQPPGSLAAAPSAATPAQTALPAAPAAYGPPSYGEGSYGQGGYGPPSYGQGSPGQGSPGQASYGQAPYQAPPHVPGTVGSHPLRRSQSAILIALLVLVLLAVGGGAYALVSHFTGHNTAAQPPGHPAVSAPAGAPSAQTSAPTPSPASAGAASPTQSAGPARTASPTGAQKAGLTVLPAAAANPAEPGVAALVNQYFTAINAHNYSAYNKLLGPRDQAADTRTSFETGYGSTTDSNEQLTGITNTSGGGEAATLAFTSHQNAADSATHTACTSWTITLYLEPSGNSYLIGPTPPGYHAQYAAC